MRRKALAVLRRSAQSVALGGVFMTAAVGGLVLHADLPATRRLVASFANQALADVFRGRIVIGNLNELSLGATGHVRVAQAEILDPEGHRVIFAGGIDARIDLRRLVRSILTGATPEIILEDAKIDNAEVVVDFDANGEIGIARAFGASPNAKVKVTPTKPTALTAESVRLSIPKVYVHHAWVHGNVVPPKLDADGDDIRAHVFIFDDRLSVDVDEVTATVRSPRVPNQSSDVRGLAKGHIGLPLAATRRDIAMKWDLVGDAAGIPLTATLGLEQDRVTAQLDVAPVAPDVVRRAFPIVPIARTVEVHAAVDGELTKPLALKANGRVGDAAFTADGELGLTENQPFRIDADLTRVDAAAFAGPTSDVSGHVHAEGAIAKGAPAGTFRVTTKEGFVLGQAAPAIAAEGRFDLQSVDASFRASEPGVDLDGELTLKIPEETLTFDVRAQSKNLRIFKRAPNVVSGSGTAHATGTLDLARSSIDAHVTADGAGIAKAPASAGSIHADATVSGPVANPLIDVTATAKQVSLVAERKDPAAKKRTPLTYPSATAHARVVLVPSPRLTDARVHIEGADGASPAGARSTNGDGAAIDATASEITFGGGGVDVRGGHVTGLGAPIDIDTHVQNGVFSLRAQGKDVDVKRIAAMTGIKQLELLPEGSLATLDVDVKTTKARADGHLDLSIAGAKDGTKAELHAKLAGRHIDARGRVAIAALGWVEMQSDLDLPGAPSLGTFERATGTIDLRGEIDLSQGVALFGGESIEQISGLALLSARIERGDARNLPTVSATARTRDLDVTFNRDGQSTHVGGIDTAIHVGYDGATDQTEASILTWDASGIVASADGKARVPVFAWLTGAQALDARAIRALEIGAVVDMPRREVSDLPGVFARKDLLGGLAARAELGGSIARPTVTLVASADDLRERKRAAGQYYAPIDGVLEARWDGKDVVATLRLDEDEASPAHVVDKQPAAVERKSGHVRGLVLARLPVSDLLDGRPPAWNASAELDVADMELAPLPLPLNMRGALTARIKLLDLTGNPVLEGRAHVDDLGIGGARVKRVGMKVEAKNGSLVASTRIREEGGGSGHIQINSSSLQWHGTEVDWDSSKSTRLEYVLDRFQLSILRPFVQRQIPELEGRVDGTGSATVDKTTHVFEGGLALSQGRIYVNALGEELTEMSAIGHFERDGGFRIQDATAKMGAGEIKASVNGRFDGLRFQSAEAVIVVPSKEGVPLSSEGATFAQATGEVRLSAKVAPDSNTLLVTVEVPRSKIVLPKRTTQNLQSLDPDETIAIGIRKPDGTLAAPAQRPGVEARTKAAAAAAAAAAADDDHAATEIAKFTVTLGNDVALEGRGLKLFLGGRTIVDVANEIAVTGQITLRQGGTIDVQGRKFVVDRGTVTFVAGEDPADPVVIAAAYWDAPDRTRIWVEFNGPLKTGKLTLRSEPPFSKNEILSILLFGRADPNSASEGERPSDAQQATALGTGIAAGGLNRALGELDDDFDLEQDKTSANRVRTKVGYKLRRNLKVQLGYASGFSQREPDTTYLFLEWQFIPQWSLIGTRGDRGTSILDVLFQHRY